MPKEVKGKKVIACSCGFNQKPEGEMAIKESVKDKKPAVAVVGEEDDNKLPVTEEEICPKCEK